MHLLSRTSCNNFSDYRYLVVSTSSLFKTSSFATTFEIFKSQLEVQTQQFAKNSTETRQLIINASSYAINDGA